MFERVIEDYRRHGSTLTNRAFWALAAYRFGVWADGLPSGPIRWAGSKLYGVQLLFVQITTGINLNRETKIGKDFHIIHPGEIVVHPNTVIGDRCGIMHGVTLGTNMKTGLAPIIGNDVFIGAGAKVLGNVVVGDGACIAANSLVIRDVPPRAIVMGVPAEIQRIREEKPQGTTEQVGGDPSLIVNK
jgi:serine O-acetyltransferase